MSVSEHSMHHIEDEPMPLKHASTDEAVCPIPAHRQVCCTSDDAASQNRRSLAHAIVTNADTYPASSAIVAWARRAVRAETGVPER